MNAEQREQFCERTEVIVGPIYDDHGKLRGWYAFAVQTMFQHHAATRADAIEGLAKQIENQKQKTP